VGGDGVPAGEFVDHGLGIGGSGHVRPWCVSSADSMSSRSRRRIRPRLTVIQCRRPAALRWRRMVVGARLAASRMAWWAVWRGCQLPSSRRLRRAVQAGAVRLVMSQTVPGANWGRDLVGSVVGDPVAPGSSTGSPIGDMGTRGPSRFTHAR
jgi:hypothetical protein